MEQPLDCGTCYLYIFDPTLRAFRCRNQKFYKGCNWMGYPVRLVWERWDTQRVRTSCQPGPKAIWAHTLFSVWSHTVANCYKLYSCNRGCMSYLLLDNTVSPHLVTSSNRAWLFLVIMQICCSAPLLDSPELTHLTGFSWRLSRQEGPIKPCLLLWSVVLTVSGVTGFFSTQPFVLKLAAPASLENHLGLVATRDGGKDRVSNSSPKAQLWKLNNASPTTFHGSKQFARLV